MLKLLVGYSGSSRRINEELARLFNACRSVDITWSTRRVYLDDIELMSRSTWFSPEEFALVFLESRVIGLGWAWALPRSNRVSLCIDPGLPMGLAEEVAKAILGWARHSFDSRGIRGVVSVSAWYEHGYFHRLLREVLDGAPIVETTWGTLMVFRGLEQKPRLPDGYRARPASLEDIPRIVEVVNRAFSIYSWFSEWREEDIRKYYERYRFAMFVAEDSEGRIVGYVDAEIFEAVDGSKTGIIATLAVDPQHQRRGIGRGLLAIAIDELVSRGAKRIILDGVSGLEPLYRKLGFVEYRRWAILVTPIAALPQLSIPMEVAG